MNIYWNGERRKLVACKEITLHPWTRPVTTECCTECMTIYVAECKLKESSHYLSLVRTVVSRFIMVPICSKMLVIRVTTSNSNIEVLECFQSKVLRLIVDAPWYVSNSVIRNDLQIPTVKQEISRFSSHYNVRISVHPNELIASLTESPIQRRLRRYWPHDLLVQI
jgi:hypothetical protein